MLLAHHFFWRFWCCCAPCCGRVFCLRLLRLLVFFVHLWSALSFFSVEVPDPFGSPMPLLRQNFTSLECIEAAGAAAAGRIPLQGAQDRFSSWRFALDVFGIPFSPVPGPEAVVFWDRLKRAVRRVRMGLHPDRWARRVDDAVLCYRIILADSTFQRAVTLVDHFDPAVVGGRVDPDDPHAPADPHPFVVRVPLASAPALIAGVLPVDNPAFLRTAFRWAVGLVNAPPAARERPVWHALLGPFVDAFLHRFVAARREARC